MQNSYNIKHSTEKIFYSINIVFLDGLMLSVILQEYGGVEATIFIVC